MGNGWPLGACCCACPEQHREDQEVLTNTGVFVEIDVLWFTFPMFPHRILPRSREVPLCTVSMVEEKRGDVPVRDGGGLGSA